MPGLSPPLLTILGLAGVAYAQEPRPVESFEADAVAAGWSAETGELQVSTDRYKSGARSLCWTWRASGACLTFRDAQAFTGIRAPKDKAPGSALCFWLYSESKSSARLLVDLLSGDEVLGTAWVLLNYAGWRPVGIPYAAVLPSPDAAVDAVRLRAPAALPEGRLFLDYVAPVLEVQVPRSYQVPWVGVEGGVQAPETCELSGDEVALGRPWLPRRGAPTDATPAELEGLVKVATRCLPAVAEGKGEVAAGTLEELRAAVSELGIRREGGVVSGRPVDFASFLKPPDAVGLEAYMGLCKRVAAAYAQAAPGPARDELGGMFADLSAHFLDQGWGYGSGLRGAGSGYTFRAWPPIFYPMRQVLDEAGLLRELSLALLYQLGGAEGALAKEPAASMDTLHLENQALLPCISMLPDLSERLQWMHAIQRYYSLVLVSPGTLGPDGSAYHHWMFHFAYASYSMPFPIRAAHALADTPFRIGPEAHQHLKRHVYAMAFATVSGQQAPILNGRAGTPMSSNMADLSRLLAEMGSPDGQQAIDPDMAGLYLTLTDKPGEQPAKAWREAGIAPVELTGHWTMNGTAAALHRRDKWLVSIVGMIKFWRGLEIYGWLQGNNYGRYARNGSIMVTAAGDPPSLEASGWAYDGWNWCHWPGTTSVVRPSSEIFDGYAMYTNPSAFAGGTNLQGDGVFGMDFSSPDVSFRRSVFCFENRVTVLTTDIVSQQDRPTVTTLFQNTYDPQTEALRVGGDRESGAPWETTIEAGEPCRLVDNKGTGYYVYPDHPPVRLRLGQQQWTYMIQRYLKDPTDNPIIDYQKRQYRHKDMEENEQYFTPSTGTFALGYFEHGTKSTDGRCAYTMLIGATLEALDSFATQMRAPETAPCSLLRSDRAAHVLWDRATDTTAYVLFESTEDTGVPGSVRGVGRPCLVMARPDGDDLWLSVASTDIANPEPIRLRLAGAWRLAEALDIEELPRVSHQGADTSIELTYGSYMPMVLRLSAER